MRWESSVSVEPSFEDAAAEALGRLAHALGGDFPDLVVAFASSHDARSCEQIPAAVASVFPGALAVGCSAGGVIGGGREVEGEPAFSVTAAVLPGVRLRPLRADAQSLGALAEASSLRSWAALAPEENPHFLLLADPFSFDTELFVRALDAVYPASVTIGGLASGGREPGSNALVLGRSAYRDGLVGIALAGDVEIDTVVAQGCRPIGEPMFITRCRHNVLLEVDGRPPVAVLGDLYSRLEPRDRDLFRHSLFLGIVMDEDRQEYRQGDFLIRNLVGVDEKSGAAAIGAVLRTGSVVQFHLRDARTSAEDLELMLSRHAREAPPPAGALLFSCLGRGKFLYGRPDHDSDALRRLVGDVALGGFFCNGEIGPVHGRTFLHGYTSSFGLFRALA